MSFKVKLLNGEHPIATQTIDAVEDPRNAALLFAALWCKLNGKSPIIEIKALGEPEKVFVFKIIMDEVSIGVQDR